jgi:Activator of Hsp90 ATPase homolog 1-like protein
MNASYTTGFTVDRTPDEVYAAINDVRSWWTGDIEGSTEAIGDEFTYRYQDVHRSTQRITESTPGTRVVWHVVEGHLTFVAETTEWTGTDIIFDISDKDGVTEVRFTHRGLVPALECFEGCSTAWGFYINSSLRDFLRG